MMGFDCVLALNSASYETPTWGAVENVVEATCTGTASEAAATTRASGGNAQTEPGLLNWEISGTMKCKNDDPDFVILRDAFINRTKLDVWASDGPIATVGSQGPRFEGKVFEFTRTEPEDGIVEYAFKIKPCKSANPVEWKEIEA